MIGLEDSQQVASNQYVIWSERKTKVAFRFSLSDQQESDSIRISFSFHENLAQQNGASWLRLRIMIMIMISKKWIQLG